MKAFSIREGSLEREIGQGHPAFIIAEMSANHRQSFDKAIEIVEAAAEAGADAIKVQTYRPDTLTLDCGSEPFKVKAGPWRGETLHSLYEKAHTPWEWQPKLKRLAESLGLFFFSAPFDATAVDFLERMQVPMYKVASFEAVHVPLLERIGKTGKPAIVSTGLASEEEIRLATETLGKAGCPATALLHCIVSYPAKPEQMNLATIQDIEKRFNAVAGLSDHSLGWQAPVLAVSLGAKVIEKHLIISRREGGPDAGFSMEREEFKQLVRKVRETEKTGKHRISKGIAEKMVGKPSYGAREAEEGNTVFRPSIWVFRDVKKGEALSRENIIVRRPNNGLPPKHFAGLMGKRASRNLKKCTPLQWDCVQE